MQPVFASQIFNLPATAGATDYMQQGVGVRPGVCRPDLVRARACAARLALAPDRPPPRVACSTVDGQTYVDHGLLSDLRPLAAGGDEHDEVVQDKTAQLRKRNTAQRMEVWRASSSPARSGCLRADPPPPPRCIARQDKAAIALLKKSVSELNR